MVVKIFDRKLLKQNRNRSVKHFSGHDFIIKEVGKRILERIEEIKNVSRQSSVVSRQLRMLEIGGREGGISRQSSVVSRQLMEDERYGRGEYPFQAGISSQLEENECVQFGEVVVTEVAEKFGNKIVVDDEELEFGEGSFDVIVSNLNLHFINDVPGFLLKVKSFLKPGGVFIASFFGGETLGELRQTLMQTEQEILGGISPRIAPMIHVKDAGMLMQKAGFSEVVSDSEIISVEYSNFFKLLHDLRNMGEGNIMMERSKKYVGKNFFKRAANLYPKNNGEMIANFEIITVVGWK